MAGPAVLSVSPQAGIVAECEHSRIKKLRDCVLNCVILCGAKKLCDRCAKQMQHEECFSSFDRKAVDKAVDKNVILKRQHAEKEMQLHPCYANYR